MVVCARTEVVSNHGGSTIRKGRQSFKGVNCVYHKSIAFFSLQQIDKRRLHGFNTDFTDN